MGNDEQNIYKIVDELAAQCVAEGKHKLADIIIHRVHKVAWTSRSELLEELRAILVNALNNTGSELSPSLRSNTQKALLGIDDELQ